MATQVDGDLRVTGNLYILGSLPAITRGNLTQENSTLFPVELTSLRIFDAFQTPLGTAGSDDLGITSGAYATGTPYITAGSLGSVGATTRYARFLFQVPYNYVSEQPAEFTLLCGITGTAPVAASVSCTVDLQAFKVGVNTLVTGSDLISSSATDMNFTAFDDVSLSLTATNLVAGDWLDCRLAIACNDSGHTASDVVPAIQKIQFACSTKG